MSTVEFGGGATEFGVLSSVIAVGALVGSLLAARRERVRLGLLIGASAAFGASCLIAALSANVIMFGVALILVGVSSLTMVNTANSYIQTTTDPAVRGRIMALYLALFAGGTPIGAPIVGAVANTLGPRWAIGIGAASGFLAATIAIAWLIIRRGMRVGRTPDTRFGLRLHFTRDEAADRELATQEIAIVQSTAQRTS
jgi:MFS family permease